MNNMFKTALLSLILCQFAPAHPRYEEIAKTLSNGSFIPKLTETLLSHEEFEALVAETESTYSKNYNEYPQDFLLTLSVYAMHDFISQAISTKQALLDRGLVLYTDYQASKMEECCTSEIVFAADILDYMCTSTLYISRKKIEALMPLDLHPFLKAGLLTDPTITFRFISNESE